MLSRRPENSKYKRTLRRAADEIREKAFGYNRQTTRRKILKLLSEFHICEIDDFTCETGIAEPEIRAALAELAAENKIKIGRRRRWQEAGKHYNEIFELADIPASAIIS
jgi:DNA-binding transcriptional ArsR family regulator